MAAPRRVIVGVDDEGRSSVVTDDVPDGIERSRGGTIWEFWRSTALPVRAADSRVNTTPAVDLPRGGVVVRMCTIPPNTPDYVPQDDLHRNGNMWIISVASGAVDLVLEAEFVRLEAGETVVLPGDLHHTLSNPLDADALLVFTAFDMV